MSTEAHIAALREFWADWLPTEAAFLAQHAWVERRHEDQEKLITDMDEEIKKLETMDEKTNKLELDLQLQQAAALCSCCEGWLGTYPCSY